MHRLFDAIPVGKQLARHRQKRLALLRQRDLARAPLQQRSAERILQRFNRQAQGRLGKIQPFAGVGEIESVSYR